MSDPLMQALANLPAAQTDAARAERIRLRCRARLARPTAAESRTERPQVPSGATGAWRPVAAAVGVAYLAEVFSHALRVWMTTLR